MDSILLFGAVGHALPRKVLSSKIKSEGNIQEFKL